MKHIPPERFKEFNDSNHPTIEEQNHFKECDYCCEGALLGCDPDEYATETAKRLNRPLPKLSRPK